PDAGEEPPPPPPAPVITAQPEPVTIDEGDTATFPVAATGIDLRFEWQSAAPGSDQFRTITGADEASFTTVALGLLDNGRRYRVVVRNEGGTRTSEAVAVTVRRVIPPPT